MGNNLPLLDTSNSTMRIFIEQMEQSGIIQRQVVNPLLSQSDRLINNFIKSLEKSGIIRQQITDPILAKLPYVYIFLAVIIVLFLYIAIISTINYCYLRNAHRSKSSNPYGNEGNKITMDYK